MNENEKKQITDVELGYMVYYADNNGEFIPLSEVKKIEDLQKHLEETISDLQKQLQMVKGIEA